MRCSRCSRERDVKFVQSIDCLGAHMIPICKVCFERHARNLIHIHEADRIWDHTDENWGKK